MRIDGYATNWVKARFPTKVADYPFDVEFVSIVDDKIEVDLVRQFDGVTEQHCFLKLEPWAAEELAKGIFASVEQRRKDTQSVQNP